jgi:hypothetical protein
VILEYIKLTMFCLWLGHKPLKLVEAPAFIRWETKDGIFMRVEICQRCRFVYWEPGK